MLNDTIVAISTPLKDGAISIVRMSGSDSFDILSKIFDKDIKNKKSHTITYGFITDENKNIIDEVLVSIFRAPNTFTREDVVEINCHGGVIVTRKVLAMCLGNGARLALPGEFSERAFLNGRIDLSQAEAINDIINAKSSNDASKAIRSIRGSIKKILTPLINDLLDIIANIEVNIDYPEYDDAIMLTQNEVLPSAIKWRDDIKTIIDKSMNSMLLKDGINTVILGKPNVGKSSLLNSLLEEDKAIVTEIEGTTRDLVEGVVRLKNITLNLIDTAGIRDTSDKVEKIGIQKSIEALENADLVLLVLDNSRELDDQDKYLLDITKDKDRIIVNNKSDVKKGEGINISAINNDIEELIKVLEEKYKDQIVDSYLDTLNNDRQIGLAIKAYNRMNNVIDMLNEGVELDLVTIDLQEAYSNLKEIIGEYSREDLIDALFRNFCLGK